STTQSEPLKPWAWIGLLAVAVATPLLWVTVKPGDAVPAAITKLQKPGALNVFEFADFQCPHCRRLHPMLKAELSQRPGEVHFQRFYVPLPSHALAEDSARAAVCAAKLGKEEEMADLLFEQPLERDIWFKHAETLALDSQAFKSCLNADQTTEVLADTIDLFNATGARGLPTTFIGSQVLKGAPPAPVVREAFEKARTGN